MEVQMAPSSVTESECANDPTFEVYVNNDWYERVGGASPATDQKHRTPEEYTNFRERALKKAVQERPVYAEGDSRE